MYPGLGFAKRRVVFFNFIMNDIIRGTSDVITGMRFTLFLNVLEDFE